MIQTAIIFGVVALIPLLVSVTRLKEKATDNEVHKMLKKEIRKTQYGIAFLFIFVAILLVILNFVITDFDTRNFVIIVLYVATLVVLVTYAIFRQIKLQNKIKDNAKK